MTFQDHPDRLRVGVLLDSLTVPSWVQSLLKEIQRGENARIELIVLNAAMPSKRTLLSRLRNPDLAFTVYTRLDTCLFRNRVESDAFAAEDARDLLAGIPVIEVTPIQERWTDRFPEEGVQAVRSADLDVILRFGFRILKGDILNTASYGVWSFHHGDNRLYRGGPAMFWEMYERNPVTGTMLQILSEKLDGETVIYRSAAATDFTSLFRNRNATYWKTSHFVARRLRDLRQEGLPSIVEPGSDREPYTRGIYRIPGAKKVLRVAARSTWRLIRNQLKTRTRRSQWFVAYAPRPESLISVRPSFIVIEPPRDRFYADPFIVEEGGAAFMFIEDYRYKSSKALVSCIEIRDRAHAEPRVVLERPYHLSYPSIFKSDGDWFMIPETSANRTIELYRATRFPWDWELDTVLFRGFLAVDATLFQHGGRFWMFASVGVPGGSTYDEVSLFFADAVRGPWIEYPRNPVVSDVRCARPAGKPFVEKGILYRPAQDCSIHYGRGMTINRVDALDPTDYRETPIATIEPTWLRCSLSTHTLNASEHWLVTDGMRPIWRR